jgi:hypothetical protein
MHAHCWARVMQTRPPGCSARDSLDEVAAGLVALSSTSVTCLVSEFPVVQLRC